MDIMKKSRKKLKITQLSLSEKINVSEHYIYLIENGYRRPSPDVAQAIADILGFDWKLFFEPKPGRKERKVSNERTESIPKQ